MFVKPSHYLFKKNIIILKHARFETIQLLSETFFNIFKHERDIK